MNCKNPPPNHRPGQAMVHLPAPDHVVQVYETAPPAARVRIIAQLIGQVYDSAPLAVRGLLLDKLLRPLGVLALVSISGGIFARIRLRSGLQDAPLALDDVQNVRTDDVLALAERVQQASTSAIHALSEVVATSPILAGSAAASALLMVLIKSRRASVADDFEA